MTNYETLYRQNKLHGTVKTAKKIRRQRDKNPLVIPPTEPLRPEDRVVVIPLGNEGYAQAKKYGKERYPRRQNWDRPEASASTYVYTRSHGRYSRRCTFTKLSYQVCYRSCGLASTRRLLVFFGDTRRILLAPRGWRFGRDEIGLYFVRRNETRINYRYHFNSDDCQTIAALRRAALDHEQRQRDWARQKRENQRRDKLRDKLRAQAQTLGVYVTIGDSIRAGNCAAGTRRWATDHGLDYRQHCRAEVLRRAAEIDGSSEFQVGRAIEVATERTIDDLIRGYCTLK